MKVIFAEWEKRNLGVDTMEFVLEQDDVEEQIRCTIEQNEKEYNVVKLPAGNFHLKSILHEMGYIYVESLFRLNHSLKPVSYNKTLKHFADRIIYEPMNAMDLERLYEEINKGIFKTDRIALDSAFSVEISNTRYINWIKDEIARGNTAIKGTFAGETISFGAYKLNENNEIFSFLGGMYSEYSNSGLAIPGTCKSVEYLLSLKPNRLYTYVSSNNPDALVCNIQAGFMVKSVQDVFVKHK